MHKLQENINTNINAFIEVYRSKQ